MPQKYKIYQYSHDPEESLSGYQESLFKEEKRDIYDFCTAVILIDNTIYSRDKIYNVSFMGSKKVLKIALLFHKKFKTLGIKYSSSFLLIQDLYLFTII